VVSFLQIFGLKFCMHFSSMPCPVYLILLEVIILLIFVKRTSYEAPHYSVSWNFLLLRAKYLPSILFSNTVNLCPFLNVGD
jgi:hypothetical protein